MNLAKFFNSENGIGLSVKEMAILDVVENFGSVGATCADLQEKISKETSKEPRLATIYSILSSLEGKGLIEPHAAERHENGGRPRQGFRITSNGRRATTLGRDIASFRCSPLPA